MRGRAELGIEAAGLGPEELFRPVLSPDDSDSGKLDSVVELLRGSRDARHVMAMVMPEAWENVQDLDPEVRASTATTRRSWSLQDGPAGVVFTDGAGVGARLDRNGLRPLRCQVCEDGFVAVCSEVGAIDVRGHGTVVRGRLGPGQMLFVDPTRGFLDDNACKERIAAGAPYAKWAADGFYRLDAGEASLETPEDLVARQAVHGLDQGGPGHGALPMASEAHEAHVLDGRRRAAAQPGAQAQPPDYLRQRFAQVTNPPIDPLRERLVMSLRTILGPQAPLLSEASPPAC